MAREIEFVNLSTFVHGYYDTFSHTYYADSARLVVASIGNSVTLSRRIPRLRRLLRSVSSRALTGRDPVVVLIELASRGTESAAPASEHIFC